jgi:hypothetical protein
MQRARLGIYAIGLPSLRRRAKHPIDGKRHVAEIDRLESAAQPGLRKDRRLLRGIQTTAISRCPEMEVCRLIATAAKHCAITQYDNEHVRWSLETQWRELDGGHEVDDGLRHLIIVDGQSPVPIFEVFDRARNFWVDLLDELNFIAKKFWVRLEGHSTKNDKPSV